MNQIERLISDLCPNGVPVWALGEAGKVVSGLRGKSKSDFTEGNAPYVSYVEIFNNPGIDFIPEKRVRVESSENQSAIQLGDVLITGSSETLNECGMTAVVTWEPTVPVYVNSFCFIWRPNKDIELDVQYAKHLFRGRDFRDQVIQTANGVTRQNISKPKFLAIEIPLPPIEVQREIASILNTFTDLETELKAEMTARKSQFLHYRTQILSLHDTEDVRWKTLGDVVRIRNGSDHKHLADGPYPLYGTGGVMRHVERYSYNKPSVLIPRKGSLKHLFFMNEPFWTVDTLFYTEINEKEVDPKFLFHWLSTQELEKLDVAGGVPSLTQTVLNRVAVPLPDLDVQRKIAEVLDTFASLLEDEVWGLPAEITARHQQYEYYRNKLLKFNELEVA